MRRLVGMGVFVLGIISSTTVLAADETIQDQVLSCLAKVGTSTDWNTCLNTMFAPCAGMDVGADDHLACLTQQRADWRTSKIRAESGVVKTLSDAGMEELSGVMLAWPKFVDQKCKAVAESRADISYEAAQIGCQIAEIALMTNEMTACAEGRSVEEYCQIKE